MLDGGATRNVDWRLIEQTKYHARGENDHYCGDDWKWQASSFERFTAHEEHQGVSQYRDASESSWLIRSNLEPYTDAYSTIKSSLLQQVTNPIRNTDIAADGEDICWFESLSSLLVELSDIQRKPTPMRAKTHWLRYYKQSHRCVFYCACAKIEYKWYLPHHILLTNLFRVLSCFNRQIMVMTMMFLSALRALTIFRIRWALHSISKSTYTFDKHVSRAAPSGAR